ncbi:MAG: cytochrome c biogenesis CcdA family protein [Candidatus Nanoarchaeia archaeon]
MVSLFLFGIAAFLAGVLTFMAPCTLPVLPAYLAFTTKTEGENATFNTFCFAVGLSIVFTSMGVFAGTIGRILLEFKREIVYILAIAVILFGFMSLFGKTIKFGNTALQRRKGPLCAFVFGGAFALAWTGCIGPVLGFVLILAANTQTALSGGILLFMYGIGLIAPLILLSAGLEKLPKDSRIWSVLKGKLFEISFGGKKYYIHSTNILSSLLFIASGVFLILEAKYKLTGLIPIGMTEWVFEAQDMLVNIFEMS